MSEEREYLVTYEVTEVYEVRIKAKSKAAALLIWSNTDGDEMDGRADRVDCCSDVTRIEDPDDPNDDGELPEDDDDE